MASRRKKGDRVSVWVGDARRLGAVVDVGRMVSCSLLLSYPGHFGCLISFFNACSTVFNCAFTVLVSNKFLLGKP